MSALGMLAFIFGFMAVSAFVLAIVVYFVFRRK